MEEKKYLTIEKNPKSKFGIDLCLDDQRIPIIQKTGDGFYRLPENPICKYIMVDLVNYHLQNADSFVLNEETRNARKYGIKNSVEKKTYPSGQSTRIKELKLSLDTCEQYLETDEQKTQWNDLMGVIREKHEAKMRELDEARKANNKVEKAKSEVLKSLEILKKAGIDLSNLLG